MTPELFKQESTLRQINETLGSLRLIAAYSIHNSSSRLQLFKDRFPLGTQSQQYSSSISRAGVESLFIHSPIFAGFFVYFEDLQLTRSQDCEQDYVQGGLRNNATSVNTL